LKLTLVEAELGEAITALTGSDDDSVHVYPLNVLPFAVNELFNVVAQVVGKVSELELAPALTVEAGFTYTVVADEVADELPLLILTVTW
jgi:hypothetical protein